jgi:hypothetical protein
MLGKDDSPLVAEGGTLQYDVERLAGYPEAAGCQLVLVQKLPQRCKKTARPFHQPLGRVDIQLNA